MKYSLMVLIVAVATLVYWQIGMDRTVHDSVAGVELENDVDANMSLAVREAESDEGREWVQSTEISVDGKGNAVPSTPINSSSNAGDFLLAATTQYGWTEQAALQNARNWSNACSKARQLNLGRDVPRESLVDFGQSFVDLIPFAEYCSSLVDAETGMISKELRGALLEATKGTQGEDPHWDGMESLIRDDKDLAQEILVSQLNRALLNFDEAYVIASILYLLRPETEAIQTTLQGHLEVSHMQYSGLVESVAMTLLCQHHGGCSGADHPMVLRKCVEAFASNGVGCFQPQNVFEAIDQTLTPVEHMLYRNLLDQVNSKLRAYRRR